MRTRWPQIVGVSGWIQGVRNRSGDVALAAMDLDGAIKDYTDAIKLPPTYVAAFSNRGRAYASKGSPQAALLALTSCAITLDVVFSSLLRVINGESSRLH